ncbi:hypothetical protein CEXT_444581 [Caerostris extrusa]|uniref:Uncharacterized protein n=1 Tax=Caerostris extrusa TaxID=172846 RepID=A0AAV4W8Z4_CAEEX|nr:hypothetical protein CEXT_444581 [Caerostris extrusa]
MRNCLVCRVDSIKLREWVSQALLSRRHNVTQQGIAGEAHVNCHFVQEVNMKGVTKMAARDKMNVMSSVAGSWTLVGAGGVLSLKLAIGKVDSPEDRMQHKIVTDYCVAIGKVIKVLQLLLSPHAFAQ